MRTMTLLALLVLLVLTACGSIGPPAAAWPAGMPPRNNNIANTPIELEVWFAADYAEQPPIVDLVNAFQRAYPNITVKITPGILWEDMLERVELAVTQGNPPDLAHSHPFTLAAQGLAEPVDD